MAVDEKTFLQTVAKALGQEQPRTAAPSRVEVGPPVFWKEQTFENNAPFELFKGNLEALTGRVQLVKNAEEATHQIETWLDELGAKTVILWDHPELKQYVSLTPNARTIFYWSAEQNPDDLKSLAEKADAGITWADYAIAYSGTLALLTGPGKGRSVSLLPPTHIAVFKKMQLVPTMSYVIADLAKRFGTDGMPSFLDFITGPSRTSDIEMDLSIGVHGPYRVWTIVIDDP